MFDIGFAELLIVMVLGLIVLGPTRLPEAIRFITLWVGRSKRQWARIREDIEREAGVEDVRRQLYNEEILETLRSSQRDIHQEVQTIEKSITPAKPRSEHGSYD